MANRSKHLCNLNDNTFTIIINHSGVTYVAKSLLLVIYKILRLFVNKLTADDKHYVLDRDNLREAIQMQVSQKQKIFYNFFFHFQNLILNFKHFPKKDDPHSWLDKCLTSCVSQDPSTDIKAIGLKHCWNLNGSTSTVFINHCEGNYAGKSSF